MTNKIVMCIFLNIQGSHLPSEEFVIRHLRSRPSQKVVYFRALTTETITNIIEQHVPFSKQCKPDAGVLPPGEVEILSLHYL